jgi:hypothetical protein
MNIISNEGGGDMSMKIEEEKTGLVENKSLLGKR